MIESRTQFICSHKEIKLEYTTIANMYTLTTPIGQKLNIPAENIEGIIKVLMTARNHRDLGIVEEYY